MSEVIYQDENGVETGRKVKGKGRPPKNSVLQPNGDLIVRVGTVVDGTPAEPRIVPEYITIDAAGTATRSPKGRGRSKLGYTKMEDGPYKGHWMKVEAVVPVEAKVETVVETQVEETVEA